jgi:signal transduction histidine kinase
MAVLHLSPSDDAFDRVDALGRIARTMLATRISCLLLVTTWLSLQHGRPGVLLGLCAGAAWLVLLITRWSTFGLILCTHPAVLAVDALLGFWVLADTTALSPALLMVGTGSVLTGLCLDRRGTAYFAPLFVAGWLLVYSGEAPQRLTSADVFVGLVLVPALLVGAMVAGVGIRGATLDAEAGERRLRRQVRAAGVAEERARLAREMHDSLVKSLHGVAMLADALPGWVEASPEKARVQAHLIADLITRASKESRELILAMRRADATAEPAELVRGTLDRWRLATGREADLVVDGEPTLPTESAYELAAILGEALENVDRHTPPGTRVRVALQARDSWVTLRVVDDGTGALPGVEGLSRPGHFGVLGMRERAARVGGAVRLTSVPGTGVTVTARLPAALEEVDLDQLDRSRREEEPA